MGVEPTSPAWKAGTSAARPRTLNGPESRVESREPETSADSRPSPALDPGLSALDSLAAIAGTDAKRWSGLSFRLMGNRPAQVREARLHSPPRPSREEPRRGVYVLGRVLHTKFVRFPGRLRAPCPQSAPVGGIEPPIFGLTGRRLTVWPHRIKCFSQDGWI